MRKALVTLVALSGLAASSTLALADGNGAVTGAAGGAVAGAVVGGPVGAVVGGAGGAIIGGAASGPDKTTVVHEHVDVPSCTTTSSKSTSYGMNGAETTRTTSTDCP